MAIYVELAWALWQCLFGCRGHRQSREGWFWHGNTGTAWSGELLSPVAMGRMVTGMGMLLQLRALGWHYGCDCRPGAAGELHTL